ncbi:MAG TPA: hypothetical protein PLV11_07770, partial [Phycicoccus elongatus]|nr:hypothetical protein [Phycicoccus elongatus]
SAAATASAAVTDAGHEVRDAHARVDEEKTAYAADLRRADVLDPDTDVTEESGPASPTGSAADLSPAVLTPAALSPEDERAHALATGQGYGDEV